MESQWHVVESHSAAVGRCFSPMVGLFYEAVPVLADEDTLVGSAIDSVFCTTGRFAFRSLKDVFRLHFVRRRPPRIADRLAESVFTPDTTEWTSVHTSLRIS